MHKLPVLNIENQQVLEMEVDSVLAETEYHPLIIKQSIVQFRNALRQGTHSTKERSEIAGSNSKLWKQKGTGRARMGSVKSPLWRHGGVVFGPKPRSYVQKINKKVKNKALLSAFAASIRDERVNVIDKIELSQPKTKSLVSILEKIGGKTTLIVVNEFSENLYLASRNLKNVCVIKAEQLNTYLLFRYQKVLIEQAAVTTLERKLVK